MRTDSCATLDTAQPRFIAHNSHYLFAWHHPALATARRRVAVVLCPPSGDEYVRAYRAWRKLAEQLAGIGFDVFRFDYEGTGDSAGDPEERVQADAWLQNIERIVHEAQTITGSSEVVLIGLRVGAMLALQAAVASGRVTSLVLWSPFRSGKACVRELKAFARISGDTRATEDIERPDMLPVGHLPPEPIVSALAQWDLDSLSTAPGFNVLLVERDDRPSDPKIGERLERLGARLTRVRPEGTAQMLSDSPRTPDDALDVITRWLGDQRWEDRQGADIENPAATGAQVAHGSGYQERAVRFGPDDRLFGILSVPSGVDVGVPAIIFLNTGSYNRVGPHRLYVPLARQWAAHGHVAFRWDLGGIGDSDAPVGAADNVSYPPHAVDDAREAIAFVRKQAPGRRVIVVGLCSGGWHAFLGARAGLPVDAIASLNAPLYLYRGEAVPTTKAWVEHQQTERYRTALHDPDRWIRALRGRSAYGSFLRFAAVYVWGKVTTRVKVAFGSRLDALARDLSDISARGVTSLFVFSNGEPGLDYFRPRARAVLRQRKARRRILYTVVDRADHTFASPAAQQMLRTILVDFVARETSRGSGHPVRSARSDPERARTRGNRSS
jgi:alpha-beta hydrolase superfamily lysophospholipase